MRISPINNNYTNNNISKNKNISFERISKIEIKKEILGEVESVSDVLNVFINILNHGIKDLGEKYMNFLANFDEKCQEQLIGMFNDEYTLIYCLESPKFMVYDDLYRETGYGRNWLANNLKIDLPKPAKEGYHTFFLYNGEEGAQILNLLEGKFSDKLMKKVVTKVNMKCAKGEYKKEDKYYWGQLLIAEERERHIEQLTKGKEVNAKTLNNVSEWEKFLRDFLNFEFS